MRPVLILALLLLASSPVLAQRAKKCTGDAADSVPQGPNPVYRDCDVERQARPRGAVPRIQMGTPTQTPREGCFIVEYEFVVDTLGDVEIPTIKLRRSDDRTMQETVRASINDLKYTPALREKRPVRQLVVYRVPMSVRIRVSSSTGTAGGGSPPRPASLCR